MYLSMYLSFFHVARAGFELCSSSLYLLSPEITLASDAHKSFLSLSVHAQATGVSQLFSLSLLRVQCS